MSHVMLTGNWVCALNKVCHNFPAYLGGCKRWQAVRPHLKLLRVLAIQCLCKCLRAAESLPA